jgi:hypothetical protein
VPRERLDTFARRGRPDLDLLIVRPGDNEVTSKLDTCQSAIVALEGAQALASGYVPEHDLAISRRADDLVVLKPYGVDRAVMS